MSILGDIIENFSFVQFLSVDDTKRKKINVVLISTRYYNSIGYQSHFYIIICGVDNMGVSNFYTLIKEILLFAQKILKNATDKKCSSYKMYSDVTKCKFYMPIASKANGHLT